MANPYKIYVVNQQSKEKTFWCFLSEPENAISSEVFANSSAYMTLAQSKPREQNSFTIPLQYSTQVSSSNKAVGLHTKVVTQSMTDTDLSSAWDANFYSGKEHKNPSLNKDSSSAPSDCVIINTNEFNLDDQKINSWYSSLTFGVESENGFIGFSWAPDPNEQYTIQPKVSFYISVGTYVENELVRMTDVSKQAAHITNENFDVRRECTVVYDSSGKWSITPGAPDKLNSDQLVSKLLDAHLDLAASHAVLVQLAQQANTESRERANANQNDIVVAVVSSIIAFIAGVSINELRNYLRNRIISKTYGEDFELQEIEVNGDNTKFTYKRKPALPYAAVSATDDYTHALKITKEALDAAKQDKKLVNYRITPKVTATDTIFE